MGVVMESERLGESTGSDEAEPRAYRLYDEAERRAYGLDNEVDRCAYRLDLQYDGAGFCGWARQPGQVSVEESLEEALAVVLRHRVRLSVAGRTDAGVHAYRQVAGFALPSAACDEVEGAVPEAH